MATTRAEDPESRLTDADRVAMLLDRYLAALTSSGRGLGVPCVPGQEPQPPYGIVLRTLVLTFVCSSGAVLDLTPDGTRVLAAFPAEAESDEEVKRAFFGSQDGNDELRREPEPGRCRPGDVLSYDGDEWCKALRDYAGGFSADACKLVDGGRDAGLPGALPLP